MICFVCLGNIVRSPLAENMFRHLSEQAGVAQRYELDSAGTGGWHVGESPDRRMRQVAAQRGFLYDGRARQFQPRDFERFDLIIAMDPENRANLRRLARSLDEEAKIHLMREFDPQAGPNAAVPDPYYGGIDGFENVYDIVERSCQGLLDALAGGKIQANTPGNK
ncbi:MAG TPA: phosphotyrosine protein phosphatase [Chloroflexi bacterium]|nr:phosphotyrosine protein phosphatase [Chloroflexota bacterium]HBY09293.1 phosphotyrosine protein phosphatase [Chloroflexota bacterium]